MELVIQGTPLGFSVAHDCNLGSTGPLGKVGASEQPLTKLGSEAPLPRCLPSFFFLKVLDWATWPRPLGPPAVHTARVGTALLTCPGRKSHRAQPWRRQCSLTQVLSRFPLGTGDPDGHCDSLGSPAEEPGDLVAQWPHKDLSSDPKETPPRTCDSINSELLVLLAEK